MTEPHQGTAEVRHSFETAVDFLKRNGETKLTTASGTPFTARATITNKGDHRGEQTIRFFQGGKEYARSYGCCWGHYYNCNRTRMGMYCQALDGEIH